MLPTVTTTAQPAADRGRPLHKHPDRAQAFGTAAGIAHVLYPAAGPQACTVALLPGRDGADLVAPPAVFVRDGAR